MHAAIHDPANRTKGTTRITHNILPAWWVWAVLAAFAAAPVYAFSPKRQKKFEDEARTPPEDEPPLG